MMVLAPIIVSLVMYGILQSPYVLIFAVFGPVFGIANVIDQRIGRRRRFRRAQAEFALDCERVREEINRAHERVRDRRNRLHPSARTIIHGGARPGIAIRLGVSTATSGLRASGGNRQLQEEVFRIEGMPFVTEARALFVSGDPLRLEAFVRAMVVQIWSCRIAEPVCLIGNELDQVITQLGACGISIAETVGAADFRIEAVDDASNNTYGSGEEDAMYIHIDDEQGGAIATAADGSRLAFRPDSLSSTEFIQWLPRLARARDRAARAEHSLPERVYLRDIIARNTEHRSESTTSEGDARASLRADFLVGDEGLVSVDLVRVGAHALISGTTGSGKSELLISWIASLCHNYSQDEIAVLGLDFKGGATFSAIQHLPQCRGVVTDLDGDEAKRVALSLHAEVRRREQVLRVAGVRDITELAPGLLTRLVVVVDEFQAMVQSHPDLMEIVVDLAARGRSLGVHLMLCTQRATGTFPESLLANCSVRIALRVEQSSDSITMVGNADAAALPREPRGRALLKIGGRSASCVQVAQTEEPDVLAIARAKGNISAPAAPLWYPPLPAQLPLNAIAADSQNTDEPGENIAFGRVDQPELQRQENAALRVGEHLYVVGGRRSGRTTALQTIREAARRNGWQTYALEPKVEAAWDLVQLLRAGTWNTPYLITIDDVDILEASFADDHRTAWMSDLLALLRMAKQRGITIVLSATTASGPLGKLHQLCSHTLMLQLSSRNEWILQGGDPSHYQSTMPPGRGRFNGELVQVAIAQTAKEQQPIHKPAAEADPITRPWNLQAGMCVIARRTAAITRWCAERDIPVQPVPQPAQLRNALPPNNTLIVGDVEEWISAFGVASKLADTRDIVTIGVSPAEWRTLFRGDPIPPAVRDPGRDGLLRCSNGSVDRLRCDALGVPVSRQHTEVGIPT